MFSKKTKKASLALRTLNLTIQNADDVTSYNSFVNISRKFNPKAPSCSAILKAMKNQDISINILTKNSALTHFFLKYEDKQNVQKLVQFINQLRQKWNLLMNSLQKNHNRKASFFDDKTYILSTTIDQPLSGNDTFILKEIIHPYLAYLQKLSVIRQEKGQEYQAKGLQNYREVWRVINLLRNISGITQNFTYIGRYYLKQYGQLIILISEALGQDIKEFVDLISSFLLNSFKYLSLSSQEDKEQREEFVRILQEMGNLNDRFNHLYLGKYFYAYLQHLKRPLWKDYNSPEFDHLFRHRS